MNDQSILPLASALCLVAVIPAMAQDRGDIVVTGTGLPDEAAPSAATVVIDRDRLVGSASGRLEDVLADAAGIQAFRRADSRSANPTSQGITIRGIGGNASSRALLIVDGVPQSDPFAGWIAFPALLPDRFGRVAVTRGGGSGRWGSGALSGVIELTSATPDLLAPFSASVALGSRNAVDANATAALIRDNGFATLTASYAQGDGFLPIVAEDRGPVDRPAPYAQGGVALRSAFEVASGIELQTAVQGFRDRRERGVPFTEITSDGGDASVRLVGRGTWRWSALAYLQARRFESGFASVSDDRETANQVLDQFSVPSTGWGGRVELSPPTGAALSVRLGADLRDTEGVTNELYSYVDGEPTRRRRAGGGTRTYGVFGDAQWSLGAVTIDGAARIDGWQITDGALSETMLANGQPITDTRFADRSGHVVTGRVGASGDVGPVRLRAAAYRGWRLPTPNELYRPFRVGADATAANAALRPEILEGVEGGFDLFPDGPVGASVTLFANRLNDAVANVTVARGPGVFPGVGFVSAAGFYRRRDNLDAIEARGVEFDMRARLGEVTATASYAWSDAVVRATGEAAGLDGLRPAQVPEHQASVTVGWQQGPVRTAATLRYQSAQFEDDQNSRLLDDAVTLDWTARAPLAGRLAVETRVENLFDARVETGFSGDAIERARPRQWWVGLAYAMD